MLARLIQAAVDGLRDSQAPLRPRPGARRDPTEIRTFRAGERFEVFKCADLQNDSRLLSNGGRAKEGVLARVELARLFDEAESLCQVGREGANA